MHTSIAKQLPPYAARALQVLEEAGCQAFVVGGFVRDCLRGEAPNDVDVATDALWYRTKDVFEHAGHAVIETGVRHGTITARIDGHNVEVTTFRTEGTYSDHRRPDVVRFVKNVEEDLSRRDFTVNAMAWNSSRGLVDPFGGGADLQAWVVRGVGDAQTRFSEDALRVMRCVRFVSKLGFTVESATAQATHALVDEIDLVARERVGAEFAGIVNGPHAVEALREFADVAAKAVPQISAMVGFDQRSRWHIYDVWEHCLHALEALDPAASTVLKHATLLHDVGKPFCQTIGADGRGHYYGHEELGARLLTEILTDLRWKSTDVAHAALLVRNHDHHIDTTPRAVRRALARFSSSGIGSREQAIAFFSELLALKRADAIAHSPESVQRRIDEADELARVLEQVAQDEVAISVAELAIGGDDLLAAGIPEGPGIGTVLQQMLRLVVDERVQNERQALLDTLPVLIGDE